MTTLSDSMEALKNVCCGTNVEPKVWGLTMKMVRDWEVIKKNHKELCENIHLVKDDNTRRALSAILENINKSMG